MKKNKDIGILERIKKSEKMTVEKLRTYPGFEDYSREEATHVIETLECYTSILVDHLMK
jgi:hypothetical protein